MKFIIYMITCLINGKIYIGQTNDLYQRWAQYKCDVKAVVEKRISPIQVMLIERAMAKHGINNFSIKIIALCESRDDCNKAEQLLIQLYDSRNPLKGYNIDYGGKVINRPPSVCAKISESLNKYYQTHESKMRGRITPPEVRQKQSVSAMGKPGTNMGKKFSDEWRDKISKALTGKTYPERHKYSSEEENKICKLYQSGLSADKIATQYSCQKSVVRSVLWRHDIQIRSREETKTNKFTKKQELEICQVYQNQPQSFAKLGKRFDCSRTCIRRVLKNHNIPITHLTPKKEAARQRTIQNTVSKKSK